MRNVAIWMLVIFGVLPLFAKDGKTPTALPDHFLIARHTFIDVGPPNDFYEIISVHGAVDGTTVERITLTPAGDTCTQTPTIESLRSTIPDTVSGILEGRNPCAIPEKALRRESRRRKQGLVFSGADVSMHVQCGGKERIVRVDVLDRDMFDSKAGTPENTSWTMRLLSRLDKAFPGGVWDRPIFAGAAEPTKSTAPSEDTARALGSGEYDSLFAGAPDRPSDLYRSSQTQLPRPDVRLVSSEPFQPEKFASGYPPLARLARIEGLVVVTFQLDANSKVTDIQFESGHPMLRPAVAAAVSEWKFPGEAVDHRIRAAIEFKTNCSTKGR